MRIPVAFIKQDKSVVAYSPVLDLSTVGKTEASARKMFVEAVQIFFDELIEMGTVDEVLSDLGWKKIRKAWAPPKVSQSPMSVRVPAFA